jgi:hypothetical protein
MSDVNTLVRDVGLKRTSKPETASQRDRRHKRDKAANLEWDDISYSSSQHGMMDPLPEVFETTPAALTLQEALAASNGCHDAHDSAYSRLVEHLFSKSQASSDCSSSRVELPRTVRHPPSTRRRVDEDQFSAPMAAENGHSADTHPIKEMMAELNTILYNQSPDAMSALLEHGLADEDEVEELRAQYSEVEEHVDGSDSE